MEPRNRKWGLGEMETKPTLCKVLITNIGPKTAEALLGGKLSFVLLLGSVAQEAKPQKEAHLCSLSRSQETESDFDNCAVCIEGYKPSDVVRILPCR